MRLLWSTDIHLNFVNRDRAQAYCEGLLSKQPDAILLSGDIAEAASIEPWLQFLDDHLHRPLYFVLGNHDYYGGSIAEVRARMSVFPRFSKNLCWLPGAGMVELTPRSCLIGHDGWGDARMGNAETSRILLNDFIHIRELAGLAPSERRRRLQSLGDEAAAHVDHHLRLALERYDVVVTLLHVPPFERACMHDGRFTDADWTPYFGCKAVGDVLLAHMKARRDRRMIVLCGHTHHEATVQVLPNLLVRTGGAEYGLPRLHGLFEIP